MALIFMDGCDHYGVAADIADKWSSVHAATKYGAAAGRFGGGAIILDNDNQPITKTIPASTEIFVQFAFKQDTAFGLDTILRFTNGTVDANTISINNASNAIKAIRDASTILEESILTLSVDIFHYFEVHLKISNTVGIFKVIVDGTPFIDFTGDTQGGQASVNLIEFEGGASTNDTTLDDIIIMDNTGSSNNALLGDVQIETIYPDGDTAQLDFTPTGAGTTNADRVDDGDAGPDDDTTYVESSTAGHIDRYTMANLATANIDSVLAVQSVTRARKDDGGTRTARNVLKSGATTSNGASIPLTTSYAYGVDVLDQNPDTSTAWTETTVNAVELGQEVLT